MSHDFIGPWSTFEALAAAAPKPLKPEPPSISHVPARMALPLAARLLGIEEQTLRKWIAAGKATPLPHPKVCRRFAREEVERLLGHPISELEMRLASLRHARRKQQFKASHAKLKRERRERGIASPDARKARRARLSDAELQARINRLLEQDAPQ